MLSLGHRSRRSLLSSLPMSLKSALSPSRPIHWKATAPESPAGTVTFKAQGQLPKLPVPELSQTLLKLKESVKPLARSSQELASTEAKIDAFAKIEGPELQRRLLELAAARDHWLEEWWDDGAYLSYRDSVVVNVSYYYGFDAHPSHLPQTPASRAAGIARGAMIFRQRLKQGLIQPDATKEGPLCMDTYRWMFDCCRVPGPQGADWSVTSAKEGDLGRSGHIIVLRKNRPWKVITAENGRLLSTAELERQIQHIYDNTLDDYPGVGVLTASNRDIWAKDFRELASSPTNKDILEEIYSSAFIICLDSSRPTDPIHHSRALWHGDVIGNQAVGLRNRWVDKPCQFIVFDNAYAGFMGEHSVMDGTPTVRLCDEVLNWLANPQSDHGTAPAESDQLLPIPLDWEVTPTTLQAIDAADLAAKELIESQELTFHLTSYGKAAIKQFGVSPDSWAQMIVQLAYKRLLGDIKKRPGGTYEAATTRRFFKGRTEAIRVVSAESDAWVASMDDPNADTIERKRLFQVAAKKHIGLAKSAGLGQGIDRHLLGLRKSILPGETTPDLFSDPLFIRSSYWVLSTSAVFSSHFPVYGWGEVVPDGFGVAYMTGYDDRLQYTITSRKEVPNAEFIAEISKAATDLYNLFSEKPKL